MEKIEIYTLNGQQIHQQNVSKMSHFELSKNTLSAGQYIAKFISSSNQSTVTFSILAN